MNPVHKLAAWRKDQVLGRVVRNSGFLFASNVISAILSIVTANLLGVGQFGALGIIMSFVSNVNRLLSFRMGDFVVRYVGDAITQGENQKAAALVKVAGLTETITSLIAYLVLIILAPLGARYIVHDSGVVPLIYLYGISILGMFATETATGVLQVDNRYRVQSRINFLQALVTALVIVYAAITRSGIWVVAIAYLAGKLIAGIAPIIEAGKSLNQILGAGWWKAPLSLLPDKRELVKFGLSTNFSGTINMVVRDSELLWVGWLFNAEVAGYFKTALAVINLVIMPINPFIATTYPEITKAISLKLWKELKVLLRRVTIIAGGWTVAVAIGLLALGRQVLFSDWIPWKGHLTHIYKPEYLPSLELILILLVGYGIANTFYWNRSLLLGFGRAEFPLQASFWGMIIKVILTVTLVPRFGYPFEAWLLSLYLGGTVLVILWEGWRSVRKVERMPA